MRRLSSVGAISTLVLGACGSEPTAAPAPQVANAPPAVAAKAGAPTDPAVPIDDVLSRVLGALDGVTRTSLSGPLTAVQSAIKKGDPNTIAAAVAIARTAPAGPIAANDDQAPELTSIALALDATAPTK